MANVIKHKRGSGSDPVASDLVVGEVAIRTDVGKLFTKMDNGSVAEIAGGGSDIAINTLSSSSGTGGGSATFNGSAYRFTLSAPPSVSAQQLLVSINGVIQKPVAGTGQPSEGFSVDGTDIILGDAPATGSDFFILTFKSLGVSEPADNSVTSAKIVDGTIVNADINDSAAIAGSKISPSFTSDLTITDVSPAINFTDSNNDSDFKIIVNDGKIKIQDTTNSNAVRFSINSSGNVGIGTASPTHMLDVSGSNPILSLNDTDTTNDRFRLTYNGGSTQLQVDPNNVRSGSHLLVAVDGTERMRIDSSGLVGIGTGDPGGYNSNANHLVINKASGNVGLTISSASNAIGSIAFADGDDNDVGMIRYAHSENNMLFTTNASERMRINSSGKVGIGTTSPASFLEIASHNNAETDKFDASNYHLHLRNTENDNGEAIGISFAITSDETAVGAAILHERDAGGSQGSLQFLTNGNGSSITERMRIDSSGRVGIGTTSPSSFDNSADDLVISTSGNTGITINSGSAGSTSEGNLVFAEGTAGSQDKFRGAIQYKHGEDRFSFYTNNSERMRIDSSGNVAIGTTTPVNNSGYGGITLNGGSGAIFSFKDSDVEKTRLALVANDTFSIQYPPGSSGHFRIDSLSADGSGNITGATERMRVDSSGNVLIGATSSEDTTGNSGPKLLHTGDLQIDGDQKSILFRSTNSTAQKQSGIQWWNENGAGVQCAIFAIREAVTQAPSALAFYTSNNVDTSSNSGQGSITNQMVINSEGEVRIQHEGSSDAVVSSDEVHGIGNTSLDTVTTNLARLVMQERQNNWISFKVGDGTHYGTIAVSGSGVAYGSNSDYRLKDNVANLTGGIALVKQLRPVTFNWNDHSGLSKTETHQGFIAHEVQALLPDAVSGEKDGMEIWGNCTDGEGNVTQTRVPENKKKEDETWTKKGENIKDQQLDTGKLIPILTAALQEAIGRIEALEAK